MLSVLAFKSPLLKILGPVVTRNRLKVWSTRFYHTIRRGCSRCCCLPFLDLPGRKSHGCTFLKRRPCWFDFTLCIVSFQSLCCPDTIFVLIVSCRLFLLPLKSLTSAVLSLTQPSTSIPSAFSRLSVCYSYGSWCLDLCLSSSWRSSSVRVYLTLEFDNRTALPNHGAHLQRVNQQRPQLPARSLCSYLCFAAEKRRSPQVRSVWPPRPTHSMAGFIFTNSPLTHPSGILQVLSLSAAPPDGG